MCNMVNIKLFFKITAGIGATQYDEQFVVLFSLTMAQLKQVSWLFQCILNHNKYYC